jgi:hypothetical protein
MKPFYYSSNNFSYKYFYNRGPSVDLGLISNFIINLLDTCLIKLKKLQ